jgi:hypothetical protein
VGKSEILADPKGFREGGVLRKRKETRVHLFGGLEVEGRWQSGLSLKFGSGRQWWQKTKLGLVGEMKKNGQTWRER